MPSFTDQLGRTLFLPQTPRRIISLVPSQTELLYTLGLDDAVVGITKFCVHPQSWFRSKTRVGGTKAVDPARIDAAMPDLIIANKEENDRFQIEALAARYPVWISDIKTLDDALAMIRAVGELTGRPAAAIDLANQISTRFQKLRIPATPIPAAYFIWRNPWMAAGSDTFISHMLHYCGYTNYFAGHDRYPVIDLSSLAGPRPSSELRSSLLLGPNLRSAGLSHILLSSEPYPFRQRHIDEIKEVLPGATVRLVDGEFFSWYGSRLLEAPEYFEQLSDI